MATQTPRSMISETSICNQALSWLGVARITSLDDVSTAGQLCRDNYYFLRDAVLEERMWTFATTRTTSTVADLDDWGIRYKHSVPLDWLAVYRVYCDVSGYEQKDYIQSEGWVREGNFVLSNDATVYMWGIKRVTDTANFSAMFVQALASRIAMDLAMPLTQNTKLAEKMTQLYAAKLDLAATRDGQQGRNERIRSHDLVDARRQ